jgi:hypothetical protein
MDSNCILVKEQFGFRKASSTELASYNLINNILSALNNKLLGGSVSCDLQKAFDCVNHSILSKLEFYTITGKAKNLIKSYMQDRFQRVLINCNSNIYTSDWQPVKHGVPQGSILGPLFFLLYINDLPKTVSALSNPILFADDTSKTITKSDPQMFK